MVDLTRVIEILQNLLYKILQTYVSLITKKKKKKKSNFDIHLLSYWNLLILFIAMTICSTYVVKFIVSLAFSTLLL